MKKISFLLIVVIALLSFCGCEKEVKNEKAKISFNKSNISVKYTGKLVDEKANGKGKFSAGVKDEKWEYSGNFKNGKAIGKGTLTNYKHSIKFQDVSIEGKYTGECSDAVINGNGKFIGNKGDTSFEYNGEWKDGKITGKGTLNTKHYTVYFSDVTRTGSYSGDVVNGKAEGSGTFTAVNDDKNEYTYTGKWKNGLFDGKGKREFKDKKLGYEEGTFKKGEFTPSVVEFLNSSGSESEMSFSVNKKAEKFIKSHKGLYPAKRKHKVLKHVKNSLKYKQLVKSPQKYGNKIFHSEDYVITQIWEEKYWGRTVTEIIARNSEYEDYIYLYYFKSLNALEDDKISIYALPIDRSYYKNTGGGTTNCYIMLGNYIRKK